MWNHILCAVWAGFYHEAQSDVFVLVSSCPTLKIILASHRSLPLKPLTPLSSCAHFPSHTPLAAACCSSSSAPTLSFPLPAEAAFPVHGSMCTHKLSRSAVHHGCQWSRWARIYGSLKLHFRLNTHINPQRCKIVTQAYEGVLQDIYIYFFFSIRPHVSEPDRKQHRTYILSLAMQTTAFQPPLTHTHPHTDATSLCS